MGDSYVFACTEYLCSARILEGIYITGMYMT